MSHDPVLDRAIGAFLGLAVGDALGTTLEFAKRDSVPHHAEMTGGGPFGLPAGSWTDDSAMAVALGTSLADCGRPDPRDMAARFLDWWRTGAYSCTGDCFDIGVTTSVALARVERSGDPFGGSHDPAAAGNGSLMRLAPIVLPHARAVASGDRASIEAAAQDARTQSRITHAAPEAVDACDAFARLLLHAIATGRSDADWPAGIEPTVAALKTSWLDKDRDAIASSGYVVHTLEAALWAVGTTATFEDALIRAVNLGDDADTVGAVTGQLAGAVYGRAAIPDRWLAPLAWRDRIEDLAVRLVG